MQIKFILLIIFIILIGFACYSNKNNSLADNQASPGENKLANPAAVKCIEDGYILKPIEKNDVSMGYICVNPETGMECEIWSYFRGECNLFTQGKE